MSRFVRMEGQGQVDARTGDLCVWTMRGLKREVTCGLPCLTSLQRAMDDLPGGDLRVADRAETRPAAHPTGPPLSLPFIEPIRELLLPAGLPGH
jgi:hypothetical protein